MIRILGIAIAVSALVYSSCKPRKHGDSELEGVAASNCHLSTRCANQISKEWDIQAIDADLMQQFMASIGVTDAVTARVAVVDSGFDDKSKDKFGTVGPVRVERAVNPSDQLFTASYVRFSEKDIGDIKLDESGHGTGVSSTIAGKETGVGKGVVLAVYRVTGPGNTGSTSGSILHMSMINACQQNQDPDGLTLINLSWGGRADESQLAIDETQDAKLLDFLQQNGCLVFKAAGNDNFRLGRKDNMDDAYLRVAAVDTSGELSAFSTVGEINAPGSDIYVVLSQSKVNKSTRPIRDCNGHSGYNFVNGTSFASPIAAGIGSQVVRVLKHLNGFSGLSAVERSRLVTRILAASQISGSINGLRAVTIARDWTKLSVDARRKALDVTGIDFLKTLLTDASDPICSTVATDCDRVSECGQKKSCLNDMRRRVAICSSLNDQTVYQSALAAFKIGEFELGHRLSQRSLSTLKDDAMRRVLLRAAVNQYLAGIGFKMNLVFKPTDRDTVYKEQREAIRKISPNFLRTVLVPYLGLLAKDSRKATSNAMDFIIDGIMFSNSIQNGLALGVDAVSGESRGSDVVAKAVEDAMVSLRAIQGEERFLRTIRDAIAGQTADSVERHRANSESIFLDTTNSSAPARILDILIRHADGSKSFKNRLVEIEASLLRGIQSMNEYYGETTEPFVLLSEIYPTRILMDGMMSRHIDSILQAVNTSDFSKLAPVQVLYLIKHVDSIAPGKRYDVAMSILRALAEDRGWGGRNDVEILEESLWLISAGWAQLNPQLQGQMSSAFVELIRNAKSISFVGQLSLGYWDNVAFGVDILDIIADDLADDRARKAGRSYRRTALINQPALQAVGAKLAAYLISVKSIKDLASIRPMFKTQKGVGHGWKGLVFGGAQTVEATPPMVYDKPHSRLDVDGPNTNQPMVSVSVDQFFSVISGFSSALVTLDYSATTSDRDLSGAKDLAKIRAAKFVVQTILDQAFDTFVTPEPGTPLVVDLMRLLPPQGAWRKSVEFISRNGGVFVSPKANDFLTAYTRATR